nr:hypothetical protein [uncultured bacterium]
MRRDRAEVIEVFQPRDDGAGVAGQYEGATRRALAHLDHPGVLQGPQRLAQGVAAHVQSLCQVALGRQAVARLDLAAGDELPDLPRYLVGGTGRSNGSEGGSRRVQGKQSCPSILASRGR